VAQIAMNMYMELNIKWSTKWQSMQHNWQISTASVVYSLAVAHSMIDWYHGGLTASQSHSLPHLRDETAEGQRNQRHYNRHLQTQLARKFHN